MSKETEWGFEARAEMVDGGCESARLRLIFEVRCSDGLMLETAGTRREEIARVLLHRLTQIFDTGASNDDQSDK